MSTPAVTIRPAAPADRPQLMHARAALWPKASAEEHRTELTAILSGTPPSTISEAIFVAASTSGRIAGFVEVDLRSHADGCDPRQPVVFIEGWYVAPDVRRSGIGRALIAAAAAWGREHGCVEMASDTWLDHDGSQRAHEAIGLAVVDRCVHYRMAL